MQDNDAVCFLARIKELVASGKRHFVIRKDRNYRQDLFDLGIGNMNKVWDVILRLEFENMTKKPELDNNGSGDFVYFYQMDMPNGKTAYIKLKIDEHRGCVCISFHPVKYGKKAKK